MKEEQENSGYRAFSLKRIAAITSITFTGLIRQKAFYVLLLFALILIGNSIFMARLSFQQEFQMLKDVSLGAISIFTSLLAIVATARVSSRRISRTAPSTRFWPSQCRALNISRANWRAFFSCSPSARW